jgi:hypothetical protein
MESDPHQSAQLEQDWLVVSKRFGDLAQQQLLLDVGAEGFRKAGRGAAFLFYLDGKPTLGYASQDHVVEQIKPSHSKDTLLRAIQTYHPNEQVVVLVSFDDLLSDRDFSCQYFLFSRGY